MFFFPIFTVDAAKSAIVRGDVLRWFVREVNESCLARKRRTLRKDAG